VGSHKHGGSRADSPKAGPLQVGFRMVGPPSGPFCANLRAGLHPAHTICSAVQAPSGLLGCLQQVLTQVAAFSAGHSSPVSALLIPVLCLPVAVRSPSKGRVHGRRPSALP
jgi:hypothetical protein